MRQFKVKTCQRCGNEYVPFSSQQKFCLDCRHITTQERTAVNYTQHRDSILSHHRLSIYGITREQYNGLMVLQGGKCAVCGGENSKGGRMTKRHEKSSLLCVDHDHETGKIRGLLCHRCNLALGFAHDDPELLTRLVKYLTARE